MGEAMQSGSATRAKRSGITRVDIIGLLVVMAVIAAIVIPAVARAKRSYRDRVRQAEVRSLMQALIGWAKFNDGRFPLPSALDLTDATVAVPGAAKNTSANIISHLLWCQSTTPELQVDDFETGNIVVDDDYAYSDPPTALRPAEAQWDPAFNADFTGAVPGNLSWAHRVPTDAEAPGWNNGLSSATPIVSSRGAKMAGIGGTAGAPQAIWADPSSLHLRKFGGGLMWEGAVAYGDGHVTFETGVFAARPRATASGAPDAIFFDEPGAEHAGNDYLSIFTTAGPERRDFTAIWD